MTEFCRRMLNDENDDSPAKCRERRRRRIRMRRLAGTSPPGSGQPSSHSGNENQTERKRMRTMSEMSDIPPAATSTSASSGENMEPVGPEAAFSETDSAEPVYGTISVSGRAREMEDTISVRTSLCHPEINRRRPLHFFGVYDGHGGPHVAALCREKLHVFFEGELMRVSCTTENESGKSITSRAEEREQEAEWEDRWRTVVTRSFQRMDEVAISTCPCGSLVYRCGCHSMEAALSGSTAVVAVVTSEYIIVANCGDSRAVLCRGGRAIPLSCDHKPDRPEELARIEAAGGRVIFLNGARVEGILAMSRAIGDKYLKPIVTSDPAITFTKREPEDECLILASDGLWDVISNDLACKVASECLKEENNGGVASREDNARPLIEDEGAEALYPSRSVLAAALLTRLALGRKSSDNISVIVVDLKRSQLSNT